MLKPLNKESAFAAIAEDLELPLVLLSSPDPNVRLAMVDKIGAALLSTNLTWRDLAERVTAPRPAAADPHVPASSPMPMSEIRVSRGGKPGASATIAVEHNPEAYGYRQRGSSYEGPSEPGEENSVVRRGESDAEAGQQLFRDALRASGAPHYEDPATGEIYPPKWVIPGVGQVQPNGTLGPLPADK